MTRAIEDREFEECCAEALENMVGYAAGFLSRAHALVGPDIAAACLVTAIFQHGNCDRI